MGMMEKMTLFLITFISLSRASVQNCEMVCGGGSSSGGSAAIVQPAVVQPAVTPGGGSGALQCNCSATGGGVPGTIIPGGGGVPGIVIPPTTPIVTVTQPPTPPPVPSISYF